MSNITHQLERLRVQFLWQSFVGNLITCALGASGIMLILACLRYVLEIPPWTTVGYLALCGLAGAVAGALALWQRPTIVETASRIDARGETQDRFLTCYRLSEKKAPGRLERLALSECNEFIEKFDVTPFVRPRRTRQALWIIVPLVATSLLHWQFRFSHRDTSESIATQERLEQSAEELLQLQEQVRSIAEQIRSEELERIAEEMEKSFESLRREKDRGSRAEAKTALRELSALEAMVQSIQEQSRRSEEELDALADALEENETTRDAADALKDRDLARAAEELQKALEELENRAGNEVDEELAKIAQAMQEALDELSPEQQQKIAEQMRKLAQSRGASGLEALRRMAQMMKQMMQNPQRARSAADAKRAMQNILQALQNMKIDEGFRGRIAQSSNQPGEDQRMGVLSMSFARAPIGDSPQNELPGIPTGQPGSEHDEGTTASPLGGLKTVNAEGNAVQLSGTLGEGESLSEMILTTGDSSRATQRYREIYDAMAPAAESAVLQENIPLGSRLYIRRYFESIRPRE
jgi:hypothetical protein